MANWYVDSNAAGAGTGADWANAYTTLAAALSAKAAGDDFWVSHAHNESSAASKILTSPGTISNPCRILCVNSAGSVPPVSADLRTTANIKTTGANNIQFSNGYVSICYGINFTASDGGGANNALIRFESAAVASGFWRLKNCALKSASTVSNGNAGFYLGSNDSRFINMVELDGTTIEFGAATGQGFQLRGNVFLRWLNTASAIVGANTPPLFSFANNPFLSRIKLINVDLSAYGSGDTIFNAIGTNEDFELINCKIDPAATVISTPTTLMTEQRFVNSDSSGNYLSAKKTYAGTQTIETTIVRTGGASDGTQAVAWKLITTANAKPLVPFEALLNEIWNDATGSSITVTVYGIWGGGAVPNNNDIWLEVEYPGDASSPIYSKASGGLADPLATAAGLASDSSTWGGSTTKFKMTATFTPQKKGPLYVKVYCGAASQTFYVDPRPEISGVTVSKSYMAAPGVYVNELSAGGGGGGGLLVNPGLSGGLL